MLNLLRRVYFPILLLLVSWVSFSLTSRPGEVNNSYVQIEVAPKSAHVALDGKSSGAGKIAVPSASHTVTVSKQGFSTQTRTVTTQPDKTTYAGFALLPNSPSTQSWYVNHQSDKLLADGIGSHEADFISSSALKKNPFLKQLPLLYGDGHGGLVHISQGVPISPGGPPAIYITASSPSSRQTALSYIRNRGYNPATMDIVFVGQSNPLGNSGD